MILRKTFWHRQYNLILISIQGIPRSRYLWDHHRHLSIPHQPYSHRLLLFYLSKLVWNWQITRYVNYYQKMNLENIHIAVIQYRDIGSLPVVACLSVLADTNIPKLTIIIIRTTLSCIFRGIGKAIESKLEHFPHWQCNKLKIQYNACDTYDSYTVFEGWIN